MEKTSMQRIKRLSLFSVAVIGLGAALGWGLKHSSSFVGRGYEPTKLWIPPDALNMGTIWESEEFAWTVPIENHEATPVAVESFGTTCNCLSIEPKSFVLGPGERRQLALKINLTSQVKEDGQIAVGLWARITKETRKPAEPLPEWKITGQVRQVLKFNRRLLYLGERSELAQPLPVQTIHMEVLVPLESLSAQCDLAGFTAKVEGLNEGKTLLRLSSATKRNLGPFEGTVSLRPVTKGGEQLPVQRLQFEGKIVPDIEAVPPAVQVGGRVMGDAFEEVVVLRSLTGREITSVRAEPEGDGLTIERLDDNLRFRIRQKVVSAGESTNRVHFYAKVTGHDVKRVLSVSYTGIDSN
jgi:hypothetical protein